MLSAALHRGRHEAREPEGQIITTGTSAFPAADPSECSDRVAR